MDFRFSMACGDSIAGVAPIFNILRIDNVETEPAERITANDEERHGEVTRGKGGWPYTMAPAKPRLAQAAAMVERDTKAGDLRKELGVTRQTLYRSVGPNGEVRPDGAKLLE
jgi:hypothetical protein